LVVLALGVNFVISIINFLIIFSTLFKLTISMKKILLTLITIVAINATVNAQMRFGVKGGLNLANVSITNASGITPKSSLFFHGGIVLDASLSESISIQPNLLFSQKGYSLDASGATSKATFNYIEIPVNFLYNATDALTIGAGPYLGYALSGSAKTTINGQTRTDDIDFDNDAKRVDYGLNITAGYEVIEGLVISANYSLGLANINKDVTTSSTNTIKNNVIGFSVTKFFGER
jgi:Outer membrane protein beta-barrel domain